MLERTIATGANASALRNGTLIDIAATRRAAIRKTILLAAFAPSDQFARQRKKDLAGRLWNESVPAKDTPVERYLATRGIAFNGDFPEDLRFHPNLLHEPSRQHHPAMVAQARDIGGEFSGIHRTYLAPDGNGLADVPQGGVKRMLGDCFGAYVRLNEGLSEKIVLAETIEDALSVAQACPDLTVWASMVRNNLRSPVPSAFYEIVLCANGNSKDPHMAERILLEAARDHEGRGHRVLVARAPQGKDFNGMLAE